MSRARGGWREDITAETTVCLKACKGIAWLEIANKLVSLKFNMLRNGSEQGMAAHCDGPVAGLSFSLADLRATGRVAVARADVVAWMMNEL